MSLFIEKKGSVVQQYFQAGKKKLYLGNLNKPQNVKTKRVLESLDYMKDRTHHYSHVEEKLVGMLPQDEKDKYLSNRLRELDRDFDIKIKQMSGTERNRYIQDRIEKLGKLKV